MNGTVPLELERLKNLKEMNLSYNKFEGFVSRDLAILDTFNMTMLNDEGLAVLLDVKVERNTAIASED